jgi:hypothetical protein
MSKRYKTYKHVVEVDKLNVTNDNIRVIKKDSKYVVEYNYFNDVWAELFIETDFEPVKWLGATKFSPGKVTIGFDKDNKLIKELQKLLIILKLYVKNNVDKPNWGPKDHMIESQNYPKLFVCKTHDHEAIDNIMSSYLFGDVVFLGSKSKDYENINLYKYSDLMEHYIKDLTSVKLVVNPSLFAFKNTGKKINNISFRSSIVRSEYKYTKSHYKSPLEESSITTELHNAAVKDPYTLSI